MPYEILPQHGYILVKLTGELLEENFKEFSTKFEVERKKMDGKLAVFQVADLSMISEKWIRELVQVYKTLKAVNGALRLVGTNDKVKAVIERMGLDRLLVSKISLRGAMIDLGLAKAKEFDVNFINPFLNATLKTFKVQCFMEAKPGKPSLKKASDPLLMGDVSGIISITSESFVGTLAISLSEAMFKVISGKMLGETCEAVTEDNVDLVGELANIILGQATIDLQKLGYGIQMALPSCVWGKDHKIKHFRSGICIVIPFETEFGTFHTEVMSNSNIANHI